MKVLSIILTCQSKRHALYLYFVHSYNFDTMCHLQAIRYRRGDWWKYFRDSPSQYWWLQRLWYIQWSSFLWRRISVGFKLPKCQRDFVSSSWSIWVRMESIIGDVTLERLRDPLSTSVGGCIISHPPCLKKNQHSISSVISEDVSKVSAYN